MTVKLLNILNVIAFCINNGNHLSIIQDLFFFTIDVFHKSMINNNHASCDIYFKFLHNRYI